MSPASTATATRLTLVATLGGLLFGYDTAVISGAVSSIDQYFIAPRGLAETARNFLSGLMVSSALIGCVIGGAAAGIVANRFGRRGALRLAAGLFVLSSLGAAWPETGLGLAGPDALPAFVFYRVLGGIGIGIASMASPLYIAEIAPREHRGRLVSYNQMAIVIGIVGVYFVNWAIARQGDEAWLHATGWRLMFASAAIPAGLFFALLFTVPDSPRWFVLRGREPEARSLLQLLGEDPDRTLGEIRASLSETSGSAPVTSFGLGVLVVGVLVSVFQQVVGINAVLYYAPEIFRNMGSSGDVALQQTVLVGTVNLLATLVAIFTVDGWGRKPLLVLGGFGMAASMAALALCFQFQSLGPIALGSMLVYIASFALSWGPVTWVLLSEMFPNSIRGTALSIAVAAQWVANWIVTLTFKMMDGSSALTATFHHGFAYWVYAAMGVLAALFVMKWVPEPKGKTLEQIEGFWRK